MQELFWSRVQSLLRVSCTIKDLLCTDPTIICSSVKGFSLSWPKRPSAQSPNHFQEYPNIVTTVFQENQEQALRWHTRQRKKRNMTVADKGLQ